MYFVPGDKNNNGNKSPQKGSKNNNRLFIIWTAVFLCIVLLLFRLFHNSNPSSTTAPPLRQKGKSHPPRIDVSLLAQKDFGLPHIKPNDEIVRHFAYTLSFDDKDKEAYWVAYTFKKEYLQGQIKRANHFEPDPEVPTGSATPDDYRNSGYDKGHLTPAADMKWDKTAMQESFYLSNVCPQDHKCNDGIWAELEKAVRSWVIEDSIEYIVTGPVLPPDGKPKIGEDQVTVPAYFYKVIFSPYPYPKAIGFIIPNQPGKVSFWHYACTVSDVEKTTGIRFFDALPGNIVPAVKGQYDINDWKESDSFNKN